MKFKKCFICLVLIIMCVFGFSLFSVKTNAISIDNTYETNTYLGDFDVNQSYFNQDSLNYYLNLPSIISNGICYSTILESNVYCSRFFIKDNYYEFLESSNNYFWMYTDSVLFDSPNYEFSFSGFDLEEVYNIGFDFLNSLLDFRFDNLVIPVNLVIRTTDSSYYIKSINTTYFNDSVEEFFYIDFMTIDNQKINYCVWDFESFEFTTNIDLEFLSFLDSYFFCDSYSYNFLTVFFNSVNTSIFHYLDIYGDYVLLSLLCFLDVYQWNNTILRDVKNYQGGYNVLATNVFNCTFFINNYFISFTFNPFSTGLSSFSNILPFYYNYEIFYDTFSYYFEFNHSGLFFLTNDVSNYFNDFVINLSTNDLEQIYQDKNKTDVENAFNQGYLKGEEVGIDSGFKTGYDSGYNVGYANGIHEGSDGEFSLRSLLGTIFMFPLSVLTTGLNVELWGINVGNVLMFIFFIALGYILIKLLLKFFGR